jgi:chromate transporter
VNAAVVGLLGAALYDPIWRTAVLTGRDLAIALAGFLLLEQWRVPPIIVVVLTVIAAVLAGGA